ncbi:BTB/POZ protein [Rhizophagus diaphanus]|nr:BTB/POZ protein [Rhizophagus diaphanus] [Rhizophagus sp. MUCL 43196]
MKGSSLSQDLKSLLNNKRYSDIEIICEDNIKLYANRVILAARSNVLDALFYNGLKESYENQIRFPTFNSHVMKIVLEYVYTGSVREESLNDDIIIIEAYSAADYFQLPDLQEFITGIFKNSLLKSCRVHNLPVLLSNVVEKKKPSLIENHILIDLIIEELSTFPLNVIEFGRLSLEALRYLLSYKHEKKMPFVTPEYEILRYCAILVGKNVSNDTYETLSKRLPILEPMNYIQVEILRYSAILGGKKVCNNAYETLFKRQPIPPISGQIEYIQVENNFTDCQKVAEILEPLIKYIDLKRINTQILAKIIEPLGIVSSEIIKDAMINTYM